MNTQDPNELIMYELYDGRANYQDTFDCTCYAVCETMKEAKMMKYRFFTDAVIFKTLSTKEPDGSYLEIKKERLN